MKVSFGNFLSLFMISAVLCSCEGTIPGSIPVTFKVTLDDVNACVPDSLENQYYEVWQTLYRDSIEAFFTQNGLELDTGAITNLNLKEAVIAVDSPPGMTLADIEFAEIFFRDTSDAGMGTKVAYLVSIADTAVQASLENNYSDLLPFLSMDVFEAGLRLFRSQPGHEICVQGTIELEITVETDSIP